MATDDPAMHDYLFSGAVKVKFVAFAECGGPKLGNDIRFHDPIACYNPVDNSIEVSTVEVHHGRDGKPDTLSFRYQDQVEDLLRRMYVRAVQFKEIMDEGNQEK